jgi:hypothetical protein
MADFTSALTWSGVLMDPPGRLRSFGVLRGCLACTQSPELRLARNCDRRHLVDDEGPEVIEQHRPEERMELGEASIRAPAAPSGPRQ